MPGWFLLMMQSLPKIVQIGSFSGSYFPAFGLNTEIFGQRMIALEIFAKKF